MESQITIKSYYTPKKKSYKRIKIIFLNKVGMNDTLYPNIKKY